MIQTLVIFLSAATFSLFSPSISATEKWSLYTLAEYGISASFPIHPTLTSNPSPDGDGKTIKYQALDIKSMRQYTIFIGRPEQKGIFETTSMDAFLDGHLKSLVSFSENGKLLTSNRLTFNGMPAMEYSYKHDVEGVPFIARGVTFMVDGGHIRLSMWYPASDTEGSKLYERFTHSFKLLPIEYHSSNTKVLDQRGITFAPPSGWVKGRTSTNYEIANFKNLTRSLSLNAAGISSYSCDTYKSELQRSGGVLEQAQITLNGQRVLKMIKFEDVPKYNVQLTSAHYCFNSNIGAVVLIGTEEKSMYWRWAPVIQGTANTVRVP